VRSGDGGEYMVVYKFFLLSLHCYLFSFLTNNK
jgi:hypothetical protein